MPELPEIIYMDMPVELSDDERKNYDNIKKENILSCKGIESIALTNALAKLSKQMQASSGFFYYRDEQKPKEQLSKSFGASKREVVKDLLTGELENKTVIVWSIFIYETEKLKEELSDLDITTDSAAFMAGEHRILIANPASSGYALNLQRATVQIFVSYNFKYGDYTQAVSRSHRMGQSEPVTIINLVAKDTLDKHVLDVLNKKDTLNNLIKRELGVAAKEENENG